jgi:hypothetical protein
LSFILLFILSFYTIRKHRNQRFAWHKVQYILFRQYILSIIKDDFISGKDGVDIWNIKRANAEFSLTNSDCIICFVNLLPL